MMATTSLSSVPAAKAVSEYELLSKMKSRLGVYIDKDDIGDDNIPMKPAKCVKGSAPSLRSSSELFPSDSGNTNMNNAYSLSQNSVFQRSDEFHLEPANSIPVPLHYSPFKSDPSVWLTPDKVPSKKSISKDASVSDHVLEPQDVNTIPLPSAWSPGMLVRPDPSLFVTPEKQSAQAFPVIKDNYATISSDSKENLGTTSLKEKHSVRFDLPSMSSGDETTNRSFEESFADDESPITLKGSEDCPDASSPQWKPFSPPKAYNPGAYSDESALDDSLLNLQSQVISSSLPESSYSHSDFLAKSANVAKSSVSLDSRKAQAQTQRRKVKKMKQNTEAEVTAREGPHFLKGPLSQYDADRPVPSIVRESKNKFVSEDYSFPFESSAVAGTSENEHVFSRPEYNSTLKVRAELDTLCQQEVDVEKALMDTLAKSEVKRTEIGEKASVYTNRMSDQFGNLVNLEPSVEGLCDRIVRMRMSKAPKKKKAPLKKKSSEDDRAPDLQEFFTPDLQHDSPDLSLPGISPVTVKLMTAPDNVAFDLYRHNRVWNGIKDF